jgi:hypothetical protein
VTGTGSTASIGGDTGLSFLAALRERADAAAAASGGWVERDLDLAGLAVRLRFAGPALVGVLVPPFEHLASEAPRPPALCIDTFDSCSTGVAPPVLPWQAPPVLPGTNPIARFQSESACVLAGGATETLTAAAPAAGEAVFCLPDARSVPPSERAAPLRDALQVLMGARERWMTHAGAVGHGRRGVLLAGRSGSGKSTLALACALAGMDFVSDDYVLLELGAPLRAHAMQSTAKLTPTSAALLGLGTERIGPEGFEPSLEGPNKALLDVRDLAPGRVRRGLDVGAVIAPVLTDAPRPELVPVGAARGLQALAPSTVLQMPARSAPLLAALGELVRRVPSFELRLSTDQAANAAVVAEAVDGLG